MLKALTLYDPWATLVVLGEKKFETRSWPTQHRGLLAIHVSKNRPREAMRFDDIEPFRSALGHNYHNLGYRHPGCIIGVVEVVACYPAGRSDARFGTLSEKELAFGDFSAGRFAWLLKNQHPLAEPITCAGHQGLWTVPPEVARLVQAARERP